MTAMRFFLPVITAAMFAIVVSVLAIEPPAGKRPRRDKAVSVVTLAPTSAVKVANPVLHDGDTLRGDLWLPFRVTLHNRPLRAFGYDAWEINRTRQTVEVNDAEVERGIKAKESLQALIDAGELYAEDSGESDPYGRISARLWIKTKRGDWIDVANWMEDRGHLRVPRTEVK